jgi:hypothetical protein
MRNKFWGAVARRLEMNRTTLAPSGHTWARLLSCERGGVAVTVAVSFPVMIGFGALALDGSIWMGNKNAIQNAADAAVLSAITALGAGNSNAHIQQEVYTTAALNGFKNGQGGVVVKPYCPPNDGPNVGKSGYCEVIITQPQHLYFGGAFGTAPTVTGRSVAQLPTNPACILALDGSAQKAIGMSGGSTIVNAPGCTVAAWSTNSDGIDLSGGASIKAAEMDYMGGYQTSGSSAVTATLKPNTKVSDPYASLSLPTYSGCDYPSIVNVSATTKTLTPGVYCGGINISGGSTVTMTAGNYIMYNGSFTVSGTSPVDATAGVSIVVTGTAGHTGVVTISGTSPITIDAPSSGAMQGVAIFVDRSAAPATNNISGGSTLTIAGSVYMPSQYMNYSGGSGACTTQLIADKITFSGGSNFGKIGGCATSTVVGMNSGGTKGIPVE